MERNKMVIAYTGHRPNKLLGGYDMHSKENLKLAKKTYKETVKIIKSISDNEKGVVLVTGGALGFDQIAFSVGAVIRNNMEDIHLHLAIPFANQDCKWIKESKEIHARHKEMADSIVLVDTLEEYSCNETVGEYSVRKMQKRNEYMVDICDYLIAAWDGSKGGTNNAINYAIKKNKKIIYIDL